MNAVPITFAQARDFIIQHHRHHPPAQGWKYGIGATVGGGELVGVVCVGRPVSRHLDDGRTLEVTRMATDGTRNACSFLYASAWRAARALGYTRLITYTLPEEGGASLRAAGWRLLHKTAAQSWDRPSRPRTDKVAVQPRLLWETAEEVA